MKNVLAFSGSNSSKSINQQLVTVVAGKISHHNVNLINLRDYSMPLYSFDIEDTEGIPKSAIEIQRLFTDADAFIVSSPEHNSSIPAAFKNTLDWVSRIATPIFGDKKSMLLLSTSPGPRGGATNLANLQSLMPWWGANIVASYSLGRFDDHYKDGKFDQNIDDELNKQVKIFVDSLG